MPQTDKEFAQQVMRDMAVDSLYRAAADAVSIVGFNDGLETAAKLLESRAATVRDVNTHKGILNPQAEWIADSYETLANEIREESR